MIYSACSLCSSGFTLQIQCTYIQLNYEYDSKPNCTCTGTNIVVVVYCKLISKCNNNVQCNIFTFLVFFYYITILKRETCHKTVTTIGVEIHFSASALFVNKQDGVANPT